MSKYQKLFDDGYFFGKMDDLGIDMDDFVKITTKDQVIWGDGMEADQDFSEYNIKNVKGEIDIKEADLAPGKNENK